MSFRRDPSAPRLAPLLLALLLGFGSATVPAWSLDLGNLVPEAPRFLVNWLNDLLEIRDPAATASGVLSLEAANDETGGTGDAGVIIDPNGNPKP